MELAICSLGDVRLATFCSFQFVGFRGNYFAVEIARAVLQPHAPPLRHLDN